MIESKYIKAVAAIVIVFAVGLVGFYIFSAEYGDGLEKTMEDEGVSEGEPVYTAPLDYGENYSSSLIMGLVGFAIVLLAGLAWFIVAKGRKDKKSA